MHPGLIIAWQQCIDISTEPFSVYPWGAPIVKHGVLIWWMYSDSGINSSHGWWPSLQGGDTPTHGITQKRKEKKVKSSLICKKKGLLSAKQPGKKGETIWSIAWVRFFPGDNNVWMKADAVAFAWSVGQCFHPVPPFFIVQLVTCEVWFSQLVTKFPCSVYCQTSKTTPALPGLSRCFGGSQPPSTPTPSNSNPAAKGTPPKILEEDIRWWLFLCCSLSLALPLFLCACYLSVIEHSTFR